MKFKQRLGVFYRKNKTIINSTLAITIFLFARQVLAEGEEASHIINNMLSEPAQDLKTAMSGNGKILLYLCELAVAAIHYIFKRNIFLFFGIIGMAIFFNIGLHLLPG